jgi:transposase
MGRVDHLSLDDLHEQLERTEGNIPTQRVLAAIGRKQGATLEELAERHNVAEKTVRNWLDRFTDRSLEAAPYDDERSGRPAKLSEEAKAAFIADLQQTPEELGYDRHSWYPVLARHHLKQEYGVEYSLRHVYRLLDEADLTYRTARPQHYRADPEDETEFRDTVQKN